MKNFIATTGIYGLLIGLFAYRVFVPNPDPRVVHISSVLLIIWLIVIAIKTVVASTTQKVTAQINLGKISVGGF